MGDEFSPPNPQPPAWPMARLVDVAADRSRAGHGMWVSLPARAASWTSEAAVTASAAVGLMT